MNSKQQNILFVAHGSRLVQYKSEAEDFVATWHEQNPQYRVQLGFLELQQPSFSELLSRVEEATIVVPLFLHHGWHLHHDLTGMISSSAKRVTVAAPLTASRGMLEALCRRLRETQPPARGSVLIYSHGSALQQQIHLSKLAQELQVKSGFPCFTAVAKGQPDLETILHNMLSSGEREITVLPHFLFSGSWQERMMSIIQAAEEEHNISIRVARPLGSSPVLFAMVQDSILNLR